MSGVNSARDRQAHEEQDAWKQRSKANNNSLIQPPRPAPWNTSFVPISSLPPGGHVNDAVKTSRLCLKCEAIRTWLKEKLSDGEQFPDHEKHRVARHESGSALRNSYVEGCHLCALIWLSFDQERETNSWNSDKVCLDDLSNIDIIFQLNPYIKEGLQLYAIAIGKEGKKIKTVELLLGPRAREY
jgi:hypothetical protein